MVVSPKMLLCDYTKWLMEMGYITIEPLDIVWMVENYNIKLERKGITYDGPLY